MDEGLENLREKHKFLTADNFVNKSRIYTKLSSIMNIYYDTITLLIAPKENLMTRSDLDFQTFEFSNFSKWIPPHVKSVSSILS